jgi:hypothetical protein
LIPFALYFESLPKIIDTIQTMANPNRFLQNLVVSGFCFYFYNELRNIVLSSLGPVPTAVGNTLKRVVLSISLLQENLSHAQDYWLCDCDHGLYGICYF